MASRSSRLAAGLAALVLTSIAFAPSAQAATRVVGPGDSIQAAVDAARRGDRILVLGRHRENVEIAKDGIRLRGLGAVLVPAAAPTPNGCSDPSSPGDVNGICVVGDVDLATEEVRREVRDVSVRGFTIRGFPASGIAALGARDATFKDNVARDNGEYGIVAFASSGTRMLGNRASGSGEAGLYVGDSPNADATLAGNHTFDNQFGIFVRNALGATVVANAVHDNCLGVLVLGDALDPAGDAKIAANAIRNNSKACPPGEEGGPISGIGVALVGTTNVTVRANAITGNTPGGDTDFAGGVVLVSGDGGTSPTDNTISGNLVLRNAPDLLWDGTGLGNVFRRNLCRTSEPAGLCR